MQQNVLVLEPAHTTAHTRAYSGNLGQLVSHSNGDRIHQPYDFVDTQKLRGYLVGEGAINGEEYPLDGGTNGTRFWQFHPDIGEHNRIIEERIKGSIDERFFIYTPDNPMNQSGDECSLVTDAFVATPRSYEHSSRVWYDPTSPAGFTPESVLLVSARLQTTPNLFENYAGGRYTTKDGNEHINIVLTHLRNKLHEEADESTRLHVDLGYGIWIGGGQGVTLRTDGRDDYAWAQEHMVSALKKILDNSDFGDAVVIKQELARIPLPSSSHTDDSMRKLVLDARRESDQRVIDDTIANHYNSAVGKALQELEKDVDVVRALKLM